jgi:hypothetical protein
MAYSGASVMNASLQGSELVLTFSPPLENARTYKVEIGADVTSVANQALEVRALLGDVFADAVVNATDRSVTVGVWTGSGLTCATDLNSDASTNAIDRSIVVGSWTGGANCAP